MSNKDDDNIQKISRMLEIGGTMLAQHCNACGAPLFRYQGRVLCPVCEDVNDPRASMQRAENAVPSAPSGKMSSSGEVENPQVAAIPESSTLKEFPEQVSQENTKQNALPLKVSVSELEHLMIRKMLSLAEGMQDETDVRRISDHLDMIDRCMDIVAKMRSSL